MATKIVFQKATKKRRKAKIALVGPAGSGKTKTALQIAESLLEPGQRIALLDTEHESASLYCDEHDFDSFELDNFHPQNYIDAMAAAQQSGCGVLIIDSLSHAWSGKGGALELVDTATKRSKSGNQFTAGWGDVTPIQNEMVEALLKCKVHLIVTLRAKMAYVQEDYIKANGSKGTTIKKVGLEPIQRQGLDFEFDVTADMDRETNDLIIDKSRCGPLRGKVFRQDGHAVGRIVKAWLSTATDDNAVPRKTEADEVKPPSNDGPTTAKAPAGVSSEDMPKYETLCDHLISKIVAAPTTEDALREQREATTALAPVPRLVAKMRAAYGVRYRELQAQEKVAS